MILYFIHFPPIFTVEVVVCCDFLKNFIYLIYFGCAGS